MVTDVDRLRLVYELDDKPAAAGFRRVQQASAQANAKIAADMGKAEGAVSGLSKAFGDTNNVRQFGFQVSQVGQQAAATGNLLGAMAIQLPDIAMLLGGAGAAMAGAGAAMAISLIPMMVEAIGESKSLADRMKELEASTDAMQEAAKLAATPISELRAKYGDLADEVQRANGMMAAFTAAQAGAQLKGAAGATAALFPDAAVQPRVYGMSDNEWAEVQEAQMRKLMKATGATREQAEELAMALRRLESANGPEAVVRDAENLLSVMERLPDSTTRLAPQFESIKGLMKQAQAQIEAIASEDQRLLEAYSKNTLELERLSEDRAKAEAKLQEALKNGSDEMVAKWGRAVQTIDAQIKELRATIRETDAQFDAMHQSVGQQYADYASSRRAGEMIRSTDAMGAAKEIIKKYEGYLGAARWDENAYRGGYGSSTVTLSDGTIQKLTKGQSVNAADAERDLERRIGLYFEEQRRVMGQAWAGLTPQQIGALTSVQHNYGSLPSRIRPALATGDANLIAQALAGLAMDYTKSERASGKAARGERPMNYNRRMGEAAAFGDTTAVSEAATAEMEKQRDIEAEQKKLDDAAAADRKRKLDDLKRWSEQLSSQLITEQQRADLERQRAEQIAAINASGQSDEAKAAAIAQVNAAMERQVTVMALTEEAKRRGVELDAQMIGSTMTYRQAIEALGESQYNAAISAQQRQAAEAKAAETTAFYAEQQRMFEEGLVDAIMQADNFGDALANLAMQMLKAGIQAELMAGLFGKGQAAGKWSIPEGGGLLSGLAGWFGGARAMGGPVDSGRAYLVGERGPEIIVPRAPGQVIPNHKLGGSISFSPSTSIVVQGGMDDGARAALLRELDRRDAAMQRKLPRLVRDAQNRGAM